MLGFRKFFSRAMATVFSLRTYIPKNPRYKVKRAWCSITDTASGDDSDIDLAVEIEEKMSNIQIHGVIYSGNQIVVRLKVKK